MFWDGERWSPDGLHRPTQTHPRRYTKLRDLLATAIMVVVLASLIVPFLGAAASSGKGRNAQASESLDASIQVFQESDKRITYHGTWRMVSDPDYLDGQARTSGAQQSEAALKFRGARVSWVGPMGPSRGMASVYVDGALVATVSTWAPSFAAARVLFQRSWDAVANHRIAILNEGTAGHSAVTLDALIVQLDTGSPASLVDDAGVPIALAVPNPEAASGAPASPTLAPAPSYAVPTAGTADPTTAPTLIVPTQSPAAEPTPSDTATTAPQPSAVLTPAPTLAPTAAPTLAPTAAPTLAPTAAPTATPAATIPANVITGIYGSAFAMDSKNNYQVGWTANQMVSYRFRAGTSSALTSIAINQRGGPGYSGGNGGILRVTVQTDSGGKPSGTILASLTFSPGNPSGNWEQQEPHRFSAPATLASGHLYHVVFSNVDTEPATNYISVNDSFQYLATTPRQPGFSDDFAVLNNRGAGWAVLPNDTPAVDLGYANGHHDGNAYAAIVADYYSIISGTLKMSRERFTVGTGDRLVRSATVRVKRISGAGALTVRLETSGGTVLGSGTVGASKIPLSTLPTPVSGNHWDEASLAGGRWVTVTFADPIVLKGGSTYNLLMSTVSGTTYAGVPLREQDGTSPHWASRAFRDGWAQATTDGASWHDVYEYAPLDFQFYLQ